MKKKLIIACLVLLLVITVSGTVLAQRNIRIMVNGNFITSDVPPQIINDRVMVPIRFIAEALNANVEWDDKTSTVTIKTHTTEAEPVARYWSNTNFSIPPIEGPDDFKKLITDAYELLRQKAPDAYKAATVYISGIEYADNLSNDVFARIIFLPNSPTAILLFSKAHYEYVSNLDRNSAVRLTASIIVHETVHAQLYYSGLAQIIDENDNEVISYLIEHRIASLLGDQNLRKSIKNLIVKEVNNL